MMLDVGASSGSTCAVKIDCSQRDSKGWMKHKRRSEITRWGGALMTPHLRHNVDVEMLHQRFMRHTVRGITLAMTGVQHQRDWSRFAAVDGGHRRRCSHDRRMAAQVAMHVLRAVGCCRAAAQGKHFCTRAQELFADGKADAGGAAHNYLQGDQSTRAHGWAGTVVILSDCRGGALTALVTS